MADGMQPLYKFRSARKDKKFEEILTHNQMLDWCNRDMDKDDFHKLDGILNHKKSQDKEKFPSGWATLVDWNNGECTWTDLDIIYGDDQGMLALHAHKHNLQHLKDPKWSCLRCITKNMKTMAHVLNQAKLRDFWNRPVHKCGIQVPQSHEEVELINMKNGNTKWADSEKLEISQLDKYESFQSLGKDGVIPKGHTKIPCHFVCDVKMDGRKKSRFVAGGHRTDAPLGSVYSGVVSL